LTPEPECIANARALGDLLTAIFGESRLEQILRELYIEVEEESS
jgi:hypothetical protein